MNNEIKSQKEKIKRNEVIIKNSNACNTLQPKNTFTKSLKATKILNSDVNESKDKGNNRLNKNILKTIIIKYQTQRFNKHKNSKKKCLKKNKNKPSKNKINKSKSKNATSIKYLNLKDNFYKNNNSNINNYYKYLNYNSFSFGFKKPGNSYIIKKNSYIKKIH